MPDVLGYARISVRDQDLEVQRRRLREEAGAIRIFEDVISGNGFDRPGLADLTQYARPGDTVCVVRLDRLGRSLEERLDTASAAGELVFHVFSAIAHFERRLIVERTRDGLAADLARGKRPGRPPLDADKLASALTLIRPACARPRPPSSSASVAPPSTVSSPPSRPRPPPPPPSTRPSDHRRRCHHLQQTADARFEK